MKTFFSCYFIMATRKYKKQRKGNLKKKSLGKKKRSMKKRGKSLKKRGGGDGDLIQPLTLTYSWGSKQKVILPWAEYVNPLYESLKKLQSEKNLSIDIIAQMYKTRIDQIYFLDDNKSLFDKFFIYSGLGVEKCDKIVDRFLMDPDTKSYKLIVCQAIKIRIYNDIMKQIDNMLISHSLKISSDSPNIKYYYCKNIPKIRDKSSTVPIFDIPSYEKLIKTNRYIKLKFQKHVDEFIKIGGIEEYKDIIIQEILDKETVELFAKLKAENDESYNRVQDVTGTYPKVNPNNKGENPMPPLSTIEEE